MTILFCIFTVIIAAIVAMWIKLLDFANASIAGSLFNVVCIPTFSRGTKEMINPCPADPTCPSSLWLRCYIPSRCAAPKRRSTPV